MASLGKLLLLFGLGSFVLNYFGYEFALVSWIDNWGYDTGIIIRIAMAVVGAALWFMGSRSQPEAEDIEADAEA
ncbi:hypothetical protein QP938_02010 [Porticoccaceae bacterium LTM1]|nr:hypothetical protein QP938_02010 [Porticoccaceae bacterium LTM1]